MVHTPPVLSTARRAYIDWARAIAVLLMIEAHTVDAWTRAIDRRSLAFGVARVAGGFAAPLFLWLAGIAVVLAASRAARTGGVSAGVERVFRRGVEIFLLAFLFRIQAFVLSPGSHPLMLFRVDILNVMGPAIALAAVLWGLTSSRRALVTIYAVTATAIAMVTPLVRTMDVDRLPIFLQWYVRPAGEYTNFTMLPWAGFVFAGAALGVVIDGVPADHRRLERWTAAAGIALVAAGFYAASRPPLYRETYFWTSSPTWFAIRVGVMMVSLAALSVLGRAAARASVQLRVLEQFGRHSLFVYWIHVELVYGYASWLWRGRLPFWGWAVAYLVFSAAMYGAVLLKNRVADAWRHPRAGATPAPVTA